MEARTYMAISDLTKLQQLKLHLRKSDLKQFALSFALNPRDFERETMLLCAAHEFGKTLDEIGLPDHWTITTIETPPCDC